MGEIRLDDICRLSFEIHEIYQHAALEILCLTQLNSVPMVGVESLRIIVI